MSYKKSDYLKFESDTKFTFKLDLQNADRTLNVQYSLDNTT